MRSQFNEQIQNLQHELENQLQISQTQVTSFKKSEIQNETTSKQLDLVTQENQQLAEELQNLTDFTQEQQEKNLEVFQQNQDLEQKLAEFQMKSNQLER